MFARIRTLTFALMMLLPMAASAHVSGVPEKSPAESTLAAIPGHVLSALASAKPVDSATTDAALTLTIVFKRDDQKGFDRYLSELYDPHSVHYRKYLTPKQASDRFGPTQSEYEHLIGYLNADGLRLIDGSSNRLTVTMRGSRAQVERATHTKIRDYRFGNATFYANQSDPMLPKDLAHHVASIEGLSNLARPHRIDWLNPIARCVNDNLKYYDNNREKTQYVCEHGSTSGYNGTKGNIDPPPPNWVGFNGTGQTVGLVEFDTFNISDVSDYLALSGDPEAIANQVSKVDVGGGAPLGPGESEVLVDIDQIVENAPGAAVVVYDGPFTGAGSSFQSLFNAAISGGSTIISNSWAYCEDQTTAADVQSLDLIFKTAAISGVTIFNASGDTGSTCLDGSANTVTVPADSPNATAVGGSSMLEQSSLAYGTETWWDGTSATPPTGQGGFGVSKFFARPSYQNSFTGASGRSVPDLVINADPQYGMEICQADAGGCPNGFRYGGTSTAAPLWAAYAAILNEAQGANLGFANSLFYPLAGTDAFHSAASMGSDFAHVGIGSPNVNLLSLALRNQSVGTMADNDNSHVYVAGGNRPPADGTTSALVVVALRDANGNTVSGKTVSLTSTSGTAVISPASGVSTVANGIVQFNVTDTIPETVMFTAKDVTDSLTLSQSPPPSLTLYYPPAAAAGIGATPNSVSADGVSFSTVSVTLHDASNNPSPGKQVVLAQGGGHSIINGPSSGTTDTTGVIKFTVTDTIAEAINYTATDVTDGNLPVPGSATVTFTGGSNPGCSLGVASPPMGSNFAVSQFATGFLSPQFAGLCFGPTGMAFDSSGNMYVATYFEGNVYKFGPSGGAAGSANRITTSPYASTDQLSGLAFSKDGQHLYMARQFGGGGGDVVEISLTDGSIIREVVGGISCATALATDPISGDLFVSQPCTPPTGSNNIVRIINPQAVSPSTSIYASPGQSSDLTFAPDGTLYTTSYNAGFGNLYIASISGTNSMTPGTVTYLAIDNNAASAVVPAFNPINVSAPQFLLLNRILNDVAELDLTKMPPVTSEALTGGSQGLYMKTGPDGCAYATQSDRIIRITALDGTCNFAASAASPTLSLSPSVVTPNPAQGTSATFTATLSNVNSPAGTSILISVTGANGQTRQARADASGRASFSYTALAPGLDTLVATTTIGNTTLTSNQAQVTWTSGKKSTFLSLNLSPLSGYSGRSVMLMAALTDVSSSPPVTLSSQMVNFTLGSGNCQATTDANGVASCNITPASAGIATLSASFTGTTQYAASQSSAGFNVMAPTPVATATATATVSATTTATSTASRTATPTASRTASATATSTATRTAMPTATSTPTRTATPSRTSTPTRTATRTATPTATSTPMGRIGPVFLAPPELDFGSCFIGKHGTIKTALLYNPFFNNGVANIGSIAIQGSPDFSIDQRDSTCKSTLGVGKTCTIVIEFDARAGGSRSGKLVVQDNAINSPQIVILDGHGDDGHGDHRR